MSKCAFDQHELEYLGHIVIPYRMKVDQGKIKAMLNWSRHTNIYELHGFLGLKGIT